MSEKFIWKEERAQLLATLGPHSCINDLERDLRKALASDEAREDHIRWLADLIREQNLKLDTHCGGYYAMCRKCGGSRGWIVTYPENHPLNMLKDGHEVLGDQFAHEYEWLREHRANPEISVEFYGRGNHPGICECNARETLAAMGEEE